MTAKKYKKAKKCCKHCQDYDKCDEKDGCCEYCDFYLKGLCTYVPHSKKVPATQTILNVETSYMFDDFRGDNYGIDDYEEYEGYD